MSRGFKIYRNTEIEREGKCASWLEDFAKSQEKTQTVLDKARERDVSYTGKNRRHATVADIVKDMRERTGLNDYLDKIKTSNNKQVKKANTESQIPEVLLQYGDIAEKIDHFVDNNIKNTYALSSTVPQLQHDILSIFGHRYGLKPQDILNEDVARYLSDKILSERSNSNKETMEHNIGYGVGKIDDADESQDVWQGLTPKNN